MLQIDYRIFHQVQSLFLVSETFICGHFIGTAESRSFFYGLSYFTHIGVIVKQEIFEV